MTAAWATEPCLWSDDPEQLAAELAAAERAFRDLHGPQPAAYRTVEIVHVIGELL